MFKKLIVLAGCAVVAGSATFAAPDMATAAPKPVKSYAATFKPKVARQLDDCQVAEFLRCMARVGDYGACQAAAQSYECPPG